MTDSQPPQGPKVHAATKFVALDLEYNQPSGTIIQVGVAIGSGQELPQQWLVRKWNLVVSEPVSPFITQLTGIRDEDLRAGVSLADCAGELGALLREQEVFVNPVTWGGGDSGDLKAAFCAQGIEFHHFGRRWIDVKTWACLLALSRPGSPMSPAGGLRSVMKRYKLAFEGQAHRADVDAFNTLRLFFHLIKRQQALESGAQLLKTV